LRGNRALGPWLHVVSKGTGWARRLAFNRSVLWVVGDAVVLRGLSGFLGVGTSLAFPPRDIALTELAQWLVPGIGTGASGLGNLENAISQAH